MSTPGVTDDPRRPVPGTPKARVLDDPKRPSRVDGPVPSPGTAEASARIDAIAACATGPGIIAHGTPALARGGLPFSRNVTPGHGYVGTIAAPGRGVDEVRNAPAA